MNKKTTAIMMTMAMVSIPAAALAADNTEVTALELMQDAAVYAVENPMTGTAGFDAEGSLSISSEDSPASSFGLAMSGNMDFAKTDDPLKAEMSLDFSLGFLGQSIADSMEMYVIQGDGTIDSYVKEGTDGSWRHDQSEFEGLWESMGLSGGEQLKEVLAKAVEEAGLDLAWDVTDNGDVYEVSGQFSYTDFQMLVDELEQDTDLSDEERQLVKDLLACLKVNAAGTFDKETHALLSYHVDLDDSDLETFCAKAMELIQMMDSSVVIPQFDIEVKALSYDVECSYGEVSEINVPEEALQTPVSVDGSSDFDTDILDLEEVLR